MFPPKDSPDLSEEEIVGLELDLYCANAGDGSVHGQQMFRTTPGRGIFIRRRYLSNMLEPSNGQKVKLVSKHT